MISLGMGKVQGDSVAHSMMLESSCVRTKHRKPCSVRIKPYIVDCKQMQAMHGQPIMKFLFTRHLEGNAYGHDGKQDAMPSRVTHTMVAKQACTISMASVAE